MISSSKSGRTGLSLVLILALAIGLLPGVALADEPESEPVAEIKEVRLMVGQTNYYVDEVEHSLDVAPFIEHGRTFVPISLVAGEFEMEADWGPEEGLTEWVSFEDESVKVDIEIGSQEIVVHENGDESTVTSDVAAQIVEDRTFLPLRAVGEIMGAEFDWGPQDAPTEWVSFVQEKEPEPIPEEYDVTFLVSDADQEPLAEAVVELDDLSAETDDEGQALFTGVAPGDYEYSVSREGYTTVEGEIAVEKDVTLEVTLEPYLEAEVQDAQELRDALEDESVTNIVFTADITADINVGRSLTIDFAEYTLEGNVVFAHEEEGTSQLQGTADPSIDGKLTVNTPEASFVNNVMVSQGITLEALAPNSYTENADGNTIVINANGVTITINGNPEAVAITEQGGDIIIKVATGVEVEINVDGNAGKVTVTADEGSKVTISGDGREDVVIEGQGDVTTGPGRYTAPPPPSPITVRLTVVGYDGTILPATDFEIVPGRRDDPTALDVLEHGLKQKGIAHEIVDSGFGLYVSSIKGQAEATFGGWDGWMYEVNGVQPMVGAVEYPVNDNDRVLFYYSRFPVISTTGEIRAGHSEFGLDIDLIGDEFVAGGSAGNWTIETGTTGLTVQSITIIGQTATINFSGTAAVGTISIQAKAAALGGDNPSDGNPDNWGSWDPLLVTVVE